MRLNSAAKALWRSAIEWRRSPNTLGRAFFFIPETKGKTLEDMEREWTRFLLKMLHHTDRGSYLRCATSFSCQTVRRPRSFANDIRQRKVESRRHLRRKNAVAGA